MQAIWAINHSVDDQTRAGNCDKALCYNKYIGVHSCTTKERVQSHQHCQNPCCGHITIIGHPHKPHHNHQLTKTTAWHSAVIAQHKAPTFCVQVEYAVTQAVFFRNKSHDKHELNVQQLQGWWWSSISLAPTICTTEDDVHCQATIVIWSLTLQHNDIMKWIGADAWLWELTTVNLTQVQQWDLSITGGRSTTQCH